MFYVCFLLSQVLGKENMDIRISKKRRVKIKCEASRNMSYEVARKTLVSWVMRGLLCHGYVTMRECLCNKVKETSVK